MSGRKSVSERMRVVRGGKCTSRIRENVMKETKVVLAKIEQPHTPQLTSKAPLPESVYEEEK